MNLKHKVLVVEDNAELASLYEARLGQEGYEVTIATDGEAALATAVKILPHIILLDVMMPQIGGFDVLDILKNTEKTKDIKIILLTAISQTKDQDYATNLGADDYLVKSETTLDEVVNCIRRNLSQDAA